jgi:hypothetical protein
VALKGEMESEVGEWENQCRDCCFSDPCVFGYISVVVEEGVYVRDCRVWGLCKVGIVGWSAGGECKGGRGSLVTGWERMEGEGEGWGKRVDGKGQNELLEREAMGFSSREGGRVEGVRVGMRE